MLLQTVYKYRLDIWYEGLKKHKLLPKTFCVQCFLTQLGLFLSLITIPALAPELPLLTILLSALSIGGLTTYLVMIVNK